MDDQFPRDSSLRKTLKAYLSNAQHNEEVSKRFHRQELSFIAADGIKELFHTINLEYKNNFQYDYLHLQLVDEDFEIRQTLNRLQIDPHALGISFIDAPEQTLQYLRDNHQPIMGASHNPLLAAILSENQHCSSAAIIPLRRGNKLIGTLNMASRDPKRFLKGAATDFIEHLAAILAVCIENALNHEKVKLLGLIDPLTGVHNRRYFEQRCHEEITHSQRNKMPVGFIIIDLDHFKSINDTYGHPVGDIVLQEVANIIRVQLRMSDILARFGGEEFVLLLSESDKDTCLDVAERIRRSIANHGQFKTMNMSRQVTASLGVTVYDGNTAGDPASTYSRLLELADNALYTAKQEGRNQVRFNDY